MIYRRAIYLAITILLLVNHVSADDLTLWYDQPADPREWTEALPLGNGRLGAMVFGGTQTERIQLNEESLWAGCPVDVFPVDYAEHLAEAQRLVVAGERLAADQYGRENLTGRPTSFRSCEPLGDLFLDFDDVGEVSNYRRELLLADAIARTVYDSNQGRITREVLISAPADVLAIRVTTDLQRKSARIVCHLSTTSSSSENHRS